jgi:hypothetical protein
MTTTVSPTWIDNAADADAFVEAHPAVELRFRKVRGGWVATIAGSTIRVLPHLPMRLAELRLTLATRYMATCYSDRAHVNTGWARAMPNWSHNNGLGAIPEIARAVMLAEIARAVMLAEAATA